MANDDKKSRAKPKAKKPTTSKKATAGASRPDIRRSAAVKAPTSEPAAAMAKAPKAIAAKAPVLVNAVKLEKKLADTAFVERAMDSLERSLKAALPAAAAVNSKLVDIAQANMNSGLELARDLAGAKSPIEVMRLGMTYWQENMGVFQAQARELRMLSASLMTKASEPIRDHIRRA